MAVVTDNTNNALPKVIFFDAVGTLFGIQKSVGDVYSQIALKHGVHSSSKEINQAFGAAFKKSPPLAFGKIEAQQVPEREYLWWYEVVKATFEQLNLICEFTDFEIFFQDLYVYFATNKPWYLYSETKKCLHKYHSRNIELGIISNFDTRIYQVLKVLQIDTYFSSITISSEAGYAKPSSVIFKTALAKYGYSPAEAWHVGDSFHDDYVGANNAGFQAFLITRDKMEVQVENQLPNLNSLG